MDAQQEDRKRGKDTETDGWTDRQTDGWTEKRDRQTDRGDQLNTKYGGLDTQEGASGRRQAPSTAYMEMRRNQVRRNAAQCGKNATRKEKERDDGHTNEARAQK